MQDIPPNLASFRAQMEVTDRFAYLDHAAVAPYSRSVRERMAHFIECRQYVAGFKEEFEDITTRLRAAIGTLIGADSEEISFVQNTSHGLNIAAQSLPLQPGENVIFCDMEFPSNVYPWMHLERLRGVEARCVPHRGGGLTVEALEEHADEHTRAVAVSSVQFLTGFRTDLEAIGNWCRDHKAYLVVDAIQSIGAIPIDVHAYPIDFLASGGPKWLMGPIGAGFLYCRQGLVEEMVPPMAGCISVSGWEDWRDYDLTFHPNARRFEMGGPNLVGMVGLLAAVELLQEAGVESIHRWTLQLTDRLADDLERRGYRVASNRDPARRSAILSFAVPGDPAQALDTLSEAGVIVSQREEYIRVSPHGYNVIEEIDRVGQALGDAEVSS
jgi:selenocysteine lyase/cysteine desulfurase